jgi:hypothetical protein
MRSGIISLFIFVVLGPPIGLIISLHGDFEALLYIAFIIFGYIFSGPIAALSSVFFIISLAVVFRCLGIAEINPSFGAVIGGVSGIIAMAFFSSLMVMFLKILSFMLFAVLVGRYVVRFDVLSDNFREARRRLL